MPNTIPSRSFLDSLPDCTVLPLRPLRTVSGDKKRTWRVSEGKGGGGDPALRCPESESPALRSPGSELKGEETRTRIRTNKGQRGRKKKTFSRWRLMSSCSFTKQIEVSPAFFWVVLKPSDPSHVAVGLWLAHS